MKYGKKIILCGFLLFSIITFLGCIKPGNNTMGLSLRELDEDDIADIHIENATWGTIFILNLTHTNLSQYPTFQEAIIEFYNTIQNPLANKSFIRKSIPKVEYTRLQSVLLLQEDGLSRFTILAYYDSYFDYRWYDE